MSPHRTLTPAVVLDSEISEIRLILQQHAGVLIDRPSEELAGLIEQHVVANKLNSAADLMGALRSSPAACEGLLECLLPGDTAFFRYPAVFDAFRQRVLTEIATRRQDESSRSLRIWSAGCSTGEEPYSIGMSICENLPFGAACNIHLVASDIRRGALEIAERGLYPAACVKTVPRNLIAAYFSRVGDHLLVKPRLRNLVTFTRMNLVEPAFLGKFDCIFCMDLLPHLSASHRSALVQRLHLYLEPGGYLFLGENEKLPNVDGKFLVQSAPGCTYYQRPMAKAAKTGR